LVHKRQLYSFFDDYTERVPKDWQVWRLLGRIKGVLREPFDPALKDCKYREVRSLMVIGWENQIETCEKVERSIQELVKMHSEAGIGMTEEEK
jgi:hypothetical protein